MIFCLYSEMEQLENRFLLSSHNVLKENKSVWCGWNLKENREAFAMVNPKN